ncbi:hypothetical protein [Pseudoxanthomonas sp.]|uniref:hypothetical protein n=1 Tax=Pseudoxanthomonas sp. TaxID=1871049 RepID=UPI002585E8E1|nr:hypothetical protein [Pseudoxanthomonas sp.]MCR6687179.1 hypothetical protein [Pseudoxanthomonas sp.]
MSLYDGSTTFQATDIDLPGNSALPVRLSRYFKVMNRRQERMMPGLADWEIDVPRLYGEFLVGKGWKTRSASLYSRCSIPAEADAAAVWNGSEYLSTINVDRPAFRRHPVAIIDGNDRGVYGQQQAVHG